MSIVRGILVIFLIVVMGDVESKCDSFADCASAGSFNDMYKCAAEYWKNCRHTDEHTQLSNEYDITINSDWDYLHELGHDGWTVKLAKYLRLECKDKKNPVDVAKCYQEQLNINSCYVAWTGGFNKGKTFILNKVCNATYPTGYEKSGETKGFNFVLKKDEMDEVDDDEDDDEDDDDDEEDEDDEDEEDGEEVDKTKNKKHQLEIVHIDTPGATRAVKPKYLQHRTMTDRFVYDVLPDLADIVVVVVDILTSHEQVLILDDLMDKIVSFSSKEKPKYLFIVHNFKSLTTKKAVKEYIKSDIMNAFRTTSTPDKVKKKCKGHKKKQIAYYTSLYKKKYQIYHFVFAADHTEAGDYYNPIATEWLRRLTNDIPCLKKEVNVLQHFMKKLEPLLRDYFYSAKITQEMLIDPPYDPYARLRRAVNWASGGYFYEDTQTSLPIQVKFNETKDPFKLEFQAVNIKNIDHEEDGVIRLAEERDLELCPSYKFGDAPQCKPTINCNVWEKPTVWGLQCTLADVNYSKSIDNFEEELKSKIFVLRAEDSCELIIYGTILPQWREYVDKHQNGSAMDNFKFLQSDAMTHGFVQKRYTMENRVCFRYNDHSKIEYKNGVLTVIVELKNKDGPKKEL